MIIIRQHLSVGKREQEGSMPRKEGPFREDSLLEYGRWPAGA